MPKEEERRTARASIAQVGAVMVVGGGIAGMQAALDLADQGFKVYLIEAKSAIGGKMAQLDKTFPTNDCAMCTISPKLVETGRHPNIEVMTLTRVVDLRGEAGNFTVTLEHQPRYVDLNKCVACGDCEKVCPVLIPDRFNEGLVKKHAIYKLYPQAVPNAYAIEKRGISACRDACPAGQRAQGYIALIREGRYHDALRVIKMDNPFPGICGRICNHRCETACNRGLVDEPVNIRALKRFVTDKVYAEPRRPVEPAPRLYPQRVAIIGAGPCGLTAAQDLVRAGYGVTVFEAMPVAGGMLRLGVPEYRLPTWIIEREIQDILDLGVELRLNTQVNNLDDLFAEGFDAVLIAVGAHEGIRLPIPGANLDGVLVNTHFLRDVRLGRYVARRGDGKPPEEGKLQLGENVLVLGGGNVAVDCARTAVRLGARVAMACLESRLAMPAHPWEVQAALEEGVQIYNDVTFERILADEDGRACGVECMRVASFHFDEIGRLHVEKVSASNFVIPCDTVIFSVGQRAGLAFIPADAGVGITSKQTIAINPNTMAATRPGVFAAGDSVSGTAFVIEAVASGHRAADSIIRYLRGETLEKPPKPELPVVRLSRQEIEQRIACGEIRRQGRVPVPELPLERRRASFEEVERGYDDASAQAEAARCLACGVCSECMSCVFACGAKAIDHDLPPRREEVQVGAIILAPGYEIYRAELSEEYGFGRYPNVITSLQYERYLSASGPTFGHIQRPSDGKAPRRIAFLQCVGSRDQSHDYCSAVCCMYATKEAIMTKEHHPQIEVQVFMMDMRAFSKGYWTYFERAEKNYGVRYIRCRISSLKEDPLTRNLWVTYQDEEGTLRAQEFDLVVLSVGMEISEEVRELGRRLGIELDEYGFCHTVKFNPVQTSRPGIYAVGPFREPKDIPESVVEASSAAACAAAQLSQARFQLTRTPEFPPEREVSGEQPRIGVFVCHCGSNIGGYLDVPAVTEYARGLPYVIHAEHNLYTCSQDSIRHIIEQIQCLHLNRVVVASCTPLTHQPLFQDALRAAGLNPYLFEMANIRNQCSWVHSHDREVATRKACQLVRMAVAKAVHLTPQKTVSVPVEHCALVVGGGVSGMTAALNLAEQGFEVHLVEKEAELGGNLRRVFTSLPPDCKGRRESPQELLGYLIQQVENQPRIVLHTQSRVVDFEGFSGNFLSRVEKRDGNCEEIRHGVTILATGGQEYRGSEYGLGAHASVLTQLDLEEKIARDPQEILEWDSLAMILCVGPAAQYCSRICCTVALKNAIALKEMNPELQVVLFYRDIRTYGFKERLYTQARQRGVLFVRYTAAQPPQVLYRNGSSRLVVEAKDPALGRTMHLSFDALVLSMPVVPSETAAEVAKLFKVPLSSEGFFQEAHVKLRPVDVSTEGIYIAGMAHYPKLADESIVQAQAAAAHAGRVLSRESILAGGKVAVVDPTQCAACLTCVRICPFNVPQVKPDLQGVGGIQGAAYIEAAICQGCGTCVAECPARAIQLMNFTDQQILAKVSALFKPIGRREVCPV
ncbi:MAG: FAD-dependent oxidoreductase [Anaerolineales bacterium]|nr:FAD-dependent oxidoreductase [Anaerolineales bacterium]